MDFVYEIDNGLDVVVDESQNQYIALRKIKWSNKPNAEYKVDLRKWNVTPEGDKPFKGFTFMTENGPNNLVHAMIENGYGRTIECLKHLSSRDDFRKSLNTILNDKNDEFYDESEGTIEDSFYDPNDMINNI